MEIMSFLRSSGRAVYRMQAIAMDDLTQEVIEWQPGGNANTIAQLIAHVVSGQDVLANDRIRGGKSLHESGWAQRTGIPLVRPEIWQRESWRLDLAAFNEYRTAVEKSMLKLLDEIGPEDLDREVEWWTGPPAPMGLRLQTVFIHHALGHFGEVSAIKGMQGLKGLPM